MSTTVNFFWFRRDLRINDNAGLYHGLRSGHPVQCLFIFDKEILDKLEDKDDKRVSFIHTEILRLHEELRKHGASLIVRYGNPLEIWKDLVNEFKINGVYANRDYEPYARKRDKEVFEFLKDKGIDFKGFKDQVIFDKNEVVKDDGEPYQVYSPYMRKWKERMNDHFSRSYPVEKYLDHLFPYSNPDIPSLDEMGFKKVDPGVPQRTIPKEIIKSYDRTRNFPANEEGTTHLSVHLRFGTISIRELTRVALDLNQKFLNELIWRDFYQMVLYHFPESGEKAIKPKYDRIEWVNDEEAFQRWCDGKTGYPLVDAGMRELNETGYMHNRVRMVVASFLTKHLLTDWRWGEAYFAKKLLDYDMASNVGGWQWAAGSGMDAAPYFRIFNPESQLEKFDPKGAYVKKWVPEWKTSDYPKPVVEHKKARERALEIYKKAVSGGDQ
ncbi:MAG: DNA photolyase family protein [Bacteroidota bacterium]|nr:DNA photolyase family protein [Bacteroidota bacterium]